MLGLLAQLTDICERDENGNGIMLFSSFGQLNRLLEHSSSTLSLKNEVWDLSQNHSGGKLITVVSKTIWMTRHPEKGGDYFHCIIISAEVMEFYQNLCKHDELYFGPDEDRASKVIERFGEGSWKLFERLVKAGQLHCWDAKALYGEVYATYVST